MPGLSRTSRPAVLPITVVGIGVVSLLLAAFVPATNPRKAEAVQYAMMKTSEDTGPQWPSTSLEAIELAGRPVFHRSRALRHITQAIPVEPAPAKQMRQLTLSGIFSTGGNGYMAALLDGTSNERILIEQGDELDGFTVTDIDRETIVFIRGDEKKVLTLHPEKP